MEVFQKSVEEALMEFQVNRNIGLTEKQILNNQRKYGKNEFSPGEKISLVKKIFDALKEPMIFILLVAVFITIGMNIYKTTLGQHAEFEESMGIIVAIILSVGIQIVMEGKSEKAFETLNSISEDVKVKVLRKGVMQYIHKKDVAVGDIIKVETGDKVPADARLIDSLQLKVDESMLTGESLATSKDFAQIITQAKTSLSERKNMIFSGTFITYGQGTAIVTAIGDNTEVGNIAAELKHTLTKSTPLQEKLDKLAKSITSLGVVISIRM